MFIVDTLSVSDQLDHLCARTMCSVLSSSAFVFARGGLRVCLACVRFGTLCSAGHTVEGHILLVFVMNFASICVTTCPYSG